MTIMPALTCIALVGALAVAGAAAAQSSDRPERPIAPGEQVVMVKNGKITYLPRRVVEENRARQFAQDDVKAERKVRTKGHKLAVHNGRIVHMPKTVPEALASAD